eukprot:CAMPEP_0114165298 /NCGR_PEP_ID=MMETSP0043_2-20121206/31175_1 /TAXON_ID=464988 /ORGANISM="Hemiselmis andersenii, Strain CCMP644" /LENGTH=58 /DNA_ID=CAMNT_0001262113 /DNA_START=127 /DNA_END=300 /DNA_ORIENTATION=-
MCHTEPDAASQLIDLVAHCELSHHCPPQVPSAPGCPTALCPGLDYPGSSMTPLGGPAR